MRILLGAALAAVVLSGCGAPAEPASAPALPSTIPSGLAMPRHPTGEAWRGLALVPADADVVTLTDYDTIRARFGVPEMTADEPVADRTAFWDRVRSDAVVLTQGILASKDARFWLDHGFTRDDVDWELRFSGPSGSGYVVAFRPDLDMAAVTRALGKKPLSGARVMSEEHLLVKGVASEGERVWASDPALPALVDGGAESAYLRRGCVPVRTALGDGATASDRGRLVGELDPRNLGDLPAFSVSFADGLATARLGTGRDDLVERAAITRAWPVTSGAAGFTDGFASDVLDDPSTGRIGLRPKKPNAAAAVTLDDLLPFAVCNRTDSLREPTG
ncbi:hypothetical protein [Nocardioides jiangxiensis]|uniref:Lipoprotein n=1 Tax=Nocardioides jiangxiensis TaxID=3064524 RepID=A0ABT9B096_9ACTN|nr:hypothetical protein [Nocardioides sp. WY-20]MDO7868266.1 hypothetical protein [Nocardioides sp. WY-20]